MRSIFPPNKTISGINVLVKTLLRGRLESLCLSFRAERGILPCVAEQIPHCVRNDGIIDLLGIICLTIGNLRQRHQERKKDAE